MEKFTVSKLLQYVIYILYMKICSRYFAAWHNNVITYITEECKQYLNMNTLTSFPFMSVAADLIKDYYGTKLGYKKQKFLWRLS